MAAGSRKAALTALRRIRRGGAWSDALIPALTAGMDRRDAALAERMTVGVLQNTALCDFYISRWSSTRPERMEPTVLDILRLSVYQLAFMERVPSHAIVNEAVELCRESGFQRASGLVNAVLRRVSENLGSLPEPPGSGADYLSVKYSHPLWLAQELTTEYGFETTEDFFRINNTQPRVTAQVNTLKTDADTLLASLKEQGVEAACHPWLPDCVEFHAATSGLNAVRDGLMYIQDAAARLSVMAAAPKSGMRVLDVCAAPGGKSFAAAIAMGNIGEICACDIHEAKLGRVREGAERIGTDIIKTRKMDGRQPDAELYEGFELVIADVPCSGMGVIRRKPEIRRKTEPELAGLPEVQLSILRGAAKCVAPGGELLYSTCTVRSSENEETVSSFLSDNKDFFAESFTLPGEIGQVDAGMLTLWPQLYGTDGFFICRMRRH